MKQWGGRARETNRVQSKPRAMTDCVSGGNMPNTTRISVERRVTEKSRESADQISEHARQVGPTEETVQAAEHLQGQCQP